MTNPVGPGPIPPQDGSTPPQTGPVGTPPTSAANATSQTASTGESPVQNWGPAWSQFQDLMRSPKNMAMFQKSLLSNMAYTMQENQNRYEANQQQLKELFPDLYE